MFLNTSPKPVASLLLVAHSKEMDRAARPSKGATSEEEEEEEKEARGAARPHEGGKPGAAAEAALAPEAAAPVE